jgi:hypothetical protein
LSKIALDYDRSDEWMIANLFETIEKVQFIWEYIWLSFTTRVDLSDEAAVFVTGKRANSYKELCKKLWSC